MLNLGLPQQNPNKNKQIRFNLHLKHQITSLMHLEADLSLCYHRFSIALNKKHWHINNKLRERCWLWQAKYRKDF